MWKLFRRSISAAITRCWQIRCACLLIFRTFYTKKRFEINKKQFIGFHWRFILWTEMRWLVEAFDSMLTNFVVVWFWLWFGQQMRSLPFLKPHSVGYSDCSTVSSTTRGQSFANLHVPFSFVLPTIHSSLIWSNEVHKIFTKALIWMKLKQTLAKFDRILDKVLEVRMYRTQLAVTNE